MKQKIFFSLLVSFMIAGAFFAGTGCKPAPTDNCTAFDNATTPSAAYADITILTTTFGRNNDPADMYYPAGMDSSSPLPMALLLQGGRCDKQYYSLFAAEVAKYGFIVAVPNHYHAFKLGPMDTDGLFAEGTQLQDYIDYMKAENSDSASPFYQKVDTGKLMMLGHSYGAACTIYALQNNCGNRSQF